MTHLLPNYIPAKWHNRIKIELDERGVHYIWTGWHNGEGHGKVQINGKARYVHRLIYAAVHGVVLGRFDYIDHLCGHKGCINVTHLEAVTPKANTDRGPGKQTQFKPLVAGAYDVRVDAGDPHYFRVPKRRSWWRYLREWLWW